MNLRRQRCAQTKGGTKQRVATLHTHVSHGVEWREGSNLFLVGDSAEVRVLAARDFTRRIEQVRCSLSYTASFGRVYPFYLVPFAEENVPKEAHMPIGDMVFAKHERAAEAWRFLREVMV